MAEKIKLTETMKRVYDKMHEKGNYSPLGLTLKIMDGRNYTFFYDVKVQGIDDPQKILSEYKVTGVTDKGGYIMAQDKEDSSKSSQIWQKNFVEIKEPRYLETFIKDYGLKNVIIHEFGKYHFQTDEVMKVLADA